VSLGTFRPGDQKTLQFSADLPGEEADNSYQDQAWM
jgi:hypothetical protein